MTDKNKFREFQVAAVDDDEEEDIAPVNDEANDGVVGVTVDSGAARRAPKLTAANGTKLDECGEAVLEFEQSGKQCGLRFLHSDVKKPLAAVNAMNDKGDTVVFSKWRSYFENEATSKKIMIESVGDTFEMT